MPPFPPIRKPTSAYSGRARGRALPIAGQRFAPIALASRWLFPPRCALCAAPGTDLCVACAADARSPVRIACRRCAIPLHTGARLCGACLARPPAFDATIAAAEYGAPFDRLILGLKFGAQLAYARLFADLLAETFDDFRQAASSDAGGDGVSRPLDVLIPVPLNAARLTERGFNQALEIARPLGRLLGLPVDSGAAVRVFDTLPQASLPRDARRRNVRGAFAVDASITGLRVGVVDDVMTTGSTLNELARALKKAGAAEVVNLVVARTP